MIVAKAINPSKLKVDAFRLEFLTALHKMEREIKKDYAKTTATWKAEKPKFDSAISLQGGPTLIVDAGGEGLGVKKWNWTDQGTKRHIIKARKKPRLFFMKGGTPKTTPGFIGSNAGSKGTSPRSPKQVMHPGTKPRKWTDAITKKWNPKFKRQMEDAMKIAAHKSGHGIT